MEDLNDAANVLSQWIEFGYEWVKSRKINYFPVSARIWKGVGKSPEKQTFMGAGSSVWHARLKEAQLVMVMSAVVKGWLVPEPEHHFINSDLCSAGVMPALPYTALQLHSVPTYSECMAQRLSCVECLGAVSQLHKYNLTRKEALGCFFPWAQPNSKEP